MPLTTYIRNTIFFQTSNPKSVGAASMNSVPLAVVHISTPFGHAYRSSIRTVVNVPHTAMKIFESLHAVMSDGKISS